MKAFFEKINKLNLIERFSLDNKKIAIIVIISIMAVYVDFSFLLKGQIASVNKSKSSALKIKNDLRALEEGLKNMQAVKSSQKSAPQRKEKKIIYEAELPALLNDISKIANANNVNILNIKPSRDAKAAAGKFTPILITMDLICGYHNFGRFLNSLENNQAFMAAESFKIEAQPQDTLRQKISLTVKTYVRK